MIKELLEQLQTRYNSPKETNTIINSKEIWSRLGSGESFAQLGFDSKEDLDKWIQDNPYTNLI